MIFDDERSLRTINNAPNFHIIKIFFYLAFHQPKDGIKGYRIEKSQLIRDLNISRTKFFDSLRWLKENTLVNELKLFFESDFMVNPYIVKNNCDLNERTKEWSRRVRIDDARIKKIANADAVNNSKSKISKKNLPRQFVRAFFL